MALPLLATVGGAMSQIFLIAGSVLTGVQAFGWDTRPFTKAVCLAQTTK